VKDDYRNPAKSSLDITSPKFNLFFFTLAYLNANKLILLNLFVFGFLPPFAVFLCLYFFPGNQPTIWYSVNGSVFSTSCLLLTINIANSLFSDLIPEFQMKKRTTEIVILLVLGMGLSVFLNLIPLALAIPESLRLVIPILGQYLNFIILNIVIEVYRTETTKITDFKSIFEISNKRLGQAIKISVGLLVVIVALVIPILVVAAFVVFLDFNRLYFYFVISAVNSLFTPIFLTSLIRKTYFKIEIQKPLAKT